jgi:peptidoglycan L-alanyl-D-glutamate endopeptidase CwlK
VARFGVVPPEVPVERSLDVLAPAFRAAVLRMLARLEGGRTEWPFETLRTADRQGYLYGFGRDYDDGRGIVTRAELADTSWHGFGLAVDVVEKDATPWDAPPDFWASLGAAARAEGLVWGGDWKHPDRPHVQWGKCPASPPFKARALLQTDGMEAVWRLYGADR